jgi:PTS system cellobiose-specific IIC component
MIISSTFWFFGIHGESLISPVMTPVVTTNLTVNMSAYQAGKPLPYIMAGNLGVYGAWITYHAFVASMFLFCKSEKLRMLPKVSAIPSVFNINEPNVFGIPTVLNIFTFIPNIICLIINLTSYYLLASAGWIGKPFLNMPFTVPVAIQAFLASADIRNGILVIVLFFVDLVICAPFIKAYDKQLIDEENK